MPVRMFHPEHGWTHAYSEQEVEQLQARGWEVEMPAKFATLEGGGVPIDPAKPIQFYEVPVVESPPKRKPGRPRKDSK